MSEGVSKLPKQGSPEFDALKNKFLLGSNLEVRKLSEQLGYTSTKNLYKAMKRRGVIRDYKPDISPEPPTSPQLDELEKQVLDIVKKSNASVGEISRRIDRSSETVIKTIDSLRAKHHEVILDEIRHEVSIPHVPSVDFKPTEFNYFRKFYRIGIVSDTQIGSIYQQMTLLHDAYSIFDKRQTDFNIHAGDVHDGIYMYRGHFDETFLHDADSQRKYSRDYFPKSKRGTKTYLIGGQHDYCFIKQNGYNILEHLCEERQDLIYKGFYSAEFSLKGLRIGLEHPGGGIAYALSYAVQKFIEDLGGYVLSRVRNKPDELYLLPIAVFFGHYHKAMYLPNYLGINAASLPCFQSRTKYLHQKRHHPDVGCAIAEIWLNESNGLSSIKLEFVNMNDQIKDKDW